MSDEELLRSAGLILKDPERQMEGITLAAILLFGKGLHDLVGAAPAQNGRHLPGGKHGTVMMTGT